MSYSSLIITFLLDTLHKVQKKLRKKNKVCSQESTHETAFPFYRIFGQPVCISLPFISISFSSHPFPSVFVQSPLVSLFLFSFLPIQSFLVISSHLISSLLFISYLFTSFLFSAMCSMVTYFTPSMLYSSLPLCLSSCLQHLKSNYYDSWQHEPPHTRVPSRLNTMILSIYYLDYHPTPDKSLLTTTEYASILTTNLFPR